MIVPRRHWCNKENGEKEYIPSKFIHIKAKLNKTTLYQCKSDQAVWEKHSELLDG